MSSYNASFCDLERQVIATLSDFSFKVFRYLNTRANEVGVCWPTIRVIAAECRRSKDAVGQALSELVEAGCIAYVRRNTQDPLTGQKLCNIYQINPQLIVIRPELIEQAQDIWKKANGKTLSAPGTDITNNRTNSRKEPTTGETQNQHQQKAHEEGQEDVQSRDDARRRNEKEAPQISTPRTRTRDELERVNRYLQQRVERNEKQSYGPLLAIERPLPDFHHEQIAQRVRQETQIPLRMARGMVQTYGWHAVKMGLDHPYMDKARSKAGFLRYLVQGRRLDPQADVGLLKG